MRAAALALVLVVASAVVLVFANTLNSWVLGGLIGGLAAILLSIPITLMIFTYLSRRHDEHTQSLVVMREEHVIDSDIYREDDYPHVYEANALPAYEDEYDEIETQRPLRALPAPGYSQSANMRREYDGRRSARTTQFLPERGNGSSPDRFVAQRGNRTPATTRSLRAQHQAAALRAARKEAEQERYGLDGITMSTAPLRKPPRTTRHLAQQDGSLRRSPRAENVRQQRPASDESDYDTFREAQTDHIPGQYPRTGPVRDPQTGQFVRNPQLPDVPHNPEITTGSLRNPLVRRAPYLYEDDPLREHFAQQIDKPIARRSSLFREPELEEEEE
ncbi:MAG TPA: hypothetical protein VFA41_23100 [Ktedonobacteraceae bacterium]|jgi:hypothetical protein|nr:hypothetical protein [Ktedonobacteraceae bacterium]